MTERLRSAEEAHDKEVDEHQRRSNDLQERLVEIRAVKAEVGAAFTEYCTRLGRCWGEQGTAVGEEFFYV